MSEKTDKKELESVSESSKQQQQQAEIVYHIIKHLFTANNNIRRLITDLRLLLSFAAIDKNAINKLHKYFKDVGIPGIIHATVEVGEEKGEKDKKKYEAASSRKYNPKISSDQQLMNLVQNSFTNTFMRLIKQKDFAGEHILSLYKDAISLAPRKVSTKEIKRKIAALKSDLEQLASQPLQNKRPLNLFEQSPETVEKFENYFASLEQSPRLKKVKPLDAVSLGLMLLAVIFCLGEESDKSMKMLLIAFVLSISAIRNFESAKEKVSVLFKQSPDFEINYHSLYDIESIKQIQSKEIKAKPALKDIEQGFEINLKPVSAEKLSSKKSEQAIETPDYKTQRVAEDPYKSLLKDRTDRYTPTLFNDLPDKKKHFNPMGVFSHKKPALDDKLKEAYIKLGYFPVEAPEFKTLVLVSFDKGAVSKMNAAAQHEFETLLKHIGFIGGNDIGGIKKLENSENKKFKYEISIAGCDPRLLSTGWTKETIIGRVMSVLHFSELAKTHKELERLTRLSMEKEMMMAEP